MKKWPNAAYPHCALDFEGDITCWGSNSQGQVSDIPEGPFTTVDAGFQHSCAINTAGAVLCWGRDDKRQLSTPPSL